MGDMGNTSQLNKRRAPEGIPNPFSSNRHLVQTCGPKTVGQSSGQMLLPTLLVVFPSGKDQACP